MAHLIDKDQIAAEIEKRRSKNAKNKLNLAASFEDNYLLSFLDTLETKNGNLEKELKILDNTLFDLDGVAVQGATHYLTVEDVKDIAKHFYELGLRAKDVNEIIKTAEDHAYFAGSENAREKLIDKACEWLKKWDAYRVCLEGNKDWFIEQFRKAMKE